jgi:5-methylcytosine-specific restriction endonuclease McrA
VRLLSLFSFLRAGCWPRVRRLHLEKYPECAACGRTELVDVHHVIPVSKDKTKECDPENLLTLCHDPCHLVHGHLMDWRRSNPDVREDCKRYREKLEASR